VRGFAAILPDAPPAVVDIPYAISIDLTLPEGRRRLASFNEQ